jgi:hypothetical protein
MKKILYEGNQIYNSISSSGSDFLAVTVPTVPVPQHWILIPYIYLSGLTIVLHFLCVCYYLKKFILLYHIPVSCIYFRCAYH